ncbi:YkvA family protein [Chitinilyticum litopenaei]|uniref:YkvA family protein n=1 Tax=Chitinilyticum litopenaei TaxID=1121276 RepID=UPI000405BF61|nr:DUF1232 domain-containing protein [Chitinilyticum litopenaei]
MDAQFEDKGFWDKLGGYAKSAGREVVGRALCLYYAAQSPATPVWAKSVIYAALAYFIFPLDAVPDLAPLVGYTDDMGTLAAALATVAFYVNDEVKAKADAALRRFFG